MNLFENLQIMNENINPIEPEYKIAEELNEGDIIETDDGLAEVIEINRMNNGLIELVYAETNGDIANCVTYPDDEFEVYPLSEYKTHGYDERTYDPFDNSDDVEE